MFVKQPADVRLWYQIGVCYQSEDPEGKTVRGLCYRHVQGEWSWRHSNRMVDEMILMVKDRNDAMLLRLSLGDHTFWNPIPYSNGTMDFTTVPPSVFRDGQFHDMTPQEVKTAWAKYEKEMLDEIDEQDDRVQYEYESRKTG